MFHLYSTKTALPKIKFSIIWFQNLQISIIFNLEYINFPNVFFVRPFSTFSHPQQPAFFSNKHCQTAATLSPLPFTPPPGLYKPSLNFPSSKKKKPIKKKTQSSGGWNPNPHLNSAPETELRNFSIGRHYIWGGRLFSVPSTTQKQKNKTD